MTLSPASTRSLAVLVIALSAALALAAASSRLARADPPRAQCHYALQARDEAVKGGTTVEQWVNQQLAEGRDEFTAVALQNGYTSMCAW